jgi:hypothetical protein
MNTLETVLAILGPQKLSAGYLTPSGSGTAHDTLRALRQQFDPITLLGAPITPPALLFTPAHLTSLSGQDAIYLDGVDGNLSMAAGPSYKFG